MGTSGDGGDGGVQSAPKPAYGLLPLLRCHRFVSELRPNCTEIKIG